MDMREANLVSARIEVVEAARAYVTDDSKGEGALFRRLVFAVLALKRAEDEAMIDHPL